MRSGSIAVVLVDESYSKHYSSGTVSSDHNLLISSSKVAKEICEPTLFIRRNERKNKGPKQKGWAHNFSIFLQQMNRKKIPQNATYRNMGEEDYCRLQYMLTVKIQNSSASIIIIMTFSTVPV